MNEKPYISRKEQARLTQKKIFDTTLVLIGKKGYQKVTIREICQSAQISIGTFYLYFSSKDDILIESFNRLDYKVTIPDRSDSLSTISWICDYFCIYIENMISSFDKSLLREIFRIHLTSGNNEFLSERRPMVRIITQTLKKEKEENRLLTEDSPDILCQKIHMFLQSYLFHWLSDNNVENSFLTQTCICDLKKFLTLYILEENKGPV